MLNNIYSAHLGTKYELLSSRTESGVQLPGNVKMSNRSWKSAFYVKLLLHKQRFSTLNELKKCIVEKIGPIEDDVVGYIEPGHGQRGIKDSGSL